MEIIKEIRLKKLINFSGKTEKELWQEFLIDPEAFPTLKKIPRFDSWLAKQIEKYDHQKQNN